MVSAVASRILLTSFTDDIEQYADTATTKAQTGILSCTYHRSLQAICGDSWSRCWQVYPQTIWHVRRRVGRGDRQTILGMVCRSYEQFRISMGLGRMVRGLLSS